MPTVIFHLLNAVCRVRWVNAEQRWMPTIDSSTAQHIRACFGGENERKILATKLRDKAVADADKDKGGKFFKQGQGNKYLTSLICVELIRNSNAYP